MNRFEEKTFYHIYPLGFLGCPDKNDGVSAPESRILRLIDNIPHIKKLGFTAVYLGPVFESAAHGYDTSDYFKIDRRLGTNEDFKRVCAAFHENGISVVLDGVFNHVGRSFWAFNELRQNRLSSDKRGWFYAREGDSNYNDGFFYEGWEGHFELVKLNLQNPAVKEHIFAAISMWIDEFNIDGLRLDVAYSLDLGFLKELHSFCKNKKADFWLMGETLHGDYNRWLNPEMLDSVTNYECYKGLYSSFNDMNLFEIAHSLNRQFGSESWCLYRGKNLYSFADNHDVSRIASILKNKAHLPLVYTLLYTMPGIPSVYYGGEFGALGDKNQGDKTLRPEFNTGEMLENGIADLRELLTKLNKLRNSSEALAYGDYTKLFLTNRQLAISRKFEDKEIIAVINADENAFTFNLGGGKKTDVLQGKEAELSALSLPPYSAMVLDEI